MAVHFHRRVLVFADDIQVENDCVITLHLTKKLVRLQSKCGQQIERDSSEESCSNLSDGALATAGNIEHADCSRNLDVWADNLEDRFPLDDSGRINFHIDLKRRFHDDIDSRAQRDHGRGRRRKRERVPSSTPLSSL